MSCHDRYTRANRIRLYKLLGAGLLLVVLTLLDLASGSARLPLSEVAAGILAGPDASTMSGVILWHIRLPMSLTEIAVGMALAVAGLQIQNITGNPLASPSTLGITSAAGFGASLAIVTGFSVAGMLWLGSALSALVMALVVSVAIYLLSQHRGMSPYMVILAGIVMNFFFMALQQLLMYWSSPEIAQLINGWTFGNLERSSWLSCSVAAGLSVLALCYLVRHTWALTALTLGEERALSLGVPVKRLRVEAFFVSALLIAGSVAFIGAIGFVGLVAPHLARLTLGEDQRFLLPATALSGALLLTASSLLAKFLSVGAVLPVGIVTSLVGVPFLLVLLLRHSTGGRA